MGLDMYAKSRADVEEHGEEIFYWRKHYPLHKWMEAKNKEKDSNATDFNCCSLFLSKEDLLELQEAILSNSLSYVPKVYVQLDSDEPHVEDIYDMQKEDLHFCSLALLELAKGKEVYYYASY